jgi:hypothetical protein
VGEPVTRTLTITAQGATAAQLPTLDGGSPDGVKVYPEPPSSEDLAGGGPPAALKTLKMALVPTRAGPLTLPEIRLAWWDTVEDRPRVAVIPQRTLEVEPAAGAASTPEPSPGSIPAPIPTPIPAAPVSQGEPDKASSKPGDVTRAPAWHVLLDGYGAGPWPWLSLLLGLGWLLTLGWILWQRRRGGSLAGGKTARGAAVRPESARSALSAVRRAFSEGDPRAAREALLTWGRVRWPDQPPAGLGTLAGRLGGGDAVRVLEAIDRAIYALGGGQGGSTWNGSAAWAQIEPLLKGGQSPGSVPGDEPLPALYPQGS